MAQDSPSSGGNDESFKEQLDRQATQERGAPQAPDTVTAKITEYIPAAAKLFGNQQQEQEQAAAPAKALSGPPNRPTHDDKIEDFVRDQHRSKDGMESI
ncbi:hypothetical protein L249_5764 [Ophiocordyceps polyrhachis-furcata BCC 54312]|uniref:Uncharacterized protein n=1 Tax=Ophiocordyceps polyrhachis-furcata BCC 54312 TaxID=1330021 RepID=A0A367L0I5_9HYPO|nr:hypothetical protein L249_5764 [Ophiocordyceps polyrhachis-furcata BCC 54312]